MATALPRLDGLDASGRRVLLRLDLNLPMKAGRVGDATRIERSLPTLGELAAAGARVAILGHRGRPRGRPDPELSLAPVAPALAARLGREVAFVPDCIGPAAAAAVGAMAAGEVVLLENLRFHAGEEENRPAFAAALAELGELYVNDAFSVAHRGHASVVALPARLPAAAGRAIERELETLERILAEPERPLGVVIGGAKISTKIDLLDTLVRHADLMAIGGGMANTFLASRGVAVGRSLCERDRLDAAAAILERARAAGCAVLLPEDGVVAPHARAGADPETVPIGDVADDRMILDIGPASGALFARHLADCRTLVWNGPLGAFELEGFDRGTGEVARAAAELTRRGRLLSVAGGGDTAAALAQAGVSGAFSYVSTAGGAFLHWLEGRPLPGIVALTGAGRDGR